MAAPNSPRDQQQLALACLNHMVADALSLAPSCIRYMSALRDPAVFRFCAIPQLMAISTLEKIVNNIDVFSGVVKLRRGTALLLMTQAQDMGMQGVYLSFLQYSRKILAAIPHTHTEAYETAEKATRAVERICLEALPAAALSTNPFSYQLNLAVFALTAVLLRHLYLRSRSMDWGVQASGEARMLPKITDSWDVLCLTGLVGCLAYIIAFAGVPVVLGMGQPTGNTPPTSPAGKKKAAGETDGDSEFSSMSEPQKLVAEAMSPAKSARKRPAKV